MHSPAFPKQPEIGKVLSSPVGKSTTHRTLSAAAAEELRRRIFSGVYPGGTQLRQDALAQDLGASRIPIREALLQLEAEGLVRIEPHRGATVTELDPKALAELYEIRLLIEPELMRLSAPGLTAEDFSALDSLLGQFEAAVAARDSLRWGELNTALHMTLYSRAGRPRMLAMAGALLRECDRYTRLQLLNSESAVERASREHGELVALARAGDAAGAENLCRAHIRHVSDSLNAALARKSGG